MTILLAGLLYLCYLNWEQVKSFMLITAVSLWAAYRKQKQQMRAAVGTEEVSGAHTVTQVGHLHSSTRQLPLEAWT